MNCDLIKERIDQSVFENQELDSAVKLHLETCTSCNAYLKESISANTVTDSLREQEPQLKNPEMLTDDIMVAISSLPESQIKKTKSSKTIQLVTRILAAASVVLIMVFGIEQYIVVDKIIRLQTQTSMVSEQNVWQQIALYNKSYDPTQVFKKVQQSMTNDNKNIGQTDFKTLLAIARFKSVDLDQYDLQKYVQLKNLIQNQNAAHD